MRRHIRLPSSAQPGGASKGRPPLFRPTAAGFTILAVILGLLLGIRSTSSFAADKPEVLLLPLKIYAPEEERAFLVKGLRSMLVSRLAGEGLSVATEDETSGLLSEGDQDGIDSEDRAEELAHQAGTDYSIFGSVTTLGGSYSLDLVLLDLTKTPPKVTRVSEATEQDQLIPKLADVAYRFRAAIEGIDYRRLMAGRDGEEDYQGTMGLFFRASEGAHTFKPSGYSNMRMAVMSFDVGDLEGDGTPEIILISRNRLIVSGREGESLTMKDMLNVATGEEFLRVSVADVDRDGKAEVYLVSLYGKRARTTVYTWDGDFKKRFHMDGHLNAIQDKRMGRAVLLFQNSKLNRLFAGDIYRMTYSGQTDLTREHPIPFKEGAQLYTLAYADINQDAVCEFLGLQDNGYLCVWSPDGGLLWEGTTKLGGSNNAVGLGDRPSPGEVLPQIELAGRVIAADVDGDGQREVLAAKNIAGFEMLKRLRIYKTSRLLAYKTEGTSSTLSKTWTTPKINYSIADLQMEGGTLYLVGQKGEFSKLSTGSSRIMWYE